MFAHYISCSRVCFDNNSFNQIVIELQVIMKIKSPGSLIPQ